MTQHRSIVGRLLAVVTLVVALVACAGAAEARPLSAKQPVLGKKHLFEPYGQGWGTYRPTHIYNGGDPSGDVTHIHWTHWGSGHAVGHGLTSAFKPGGGYYSKPVKIVLHASSLGHCSAGGPLAYRQLHFKEQKKPGSSHYTHYSSWSDLTSICARTYKQ